MPLGKRPDLVEDRAHESRDGRLARAGVAGEDEVERRLSGWQPLGCAVCVYLHEVRELGYFPFDALEPDQALKLVHRAWMVNPVDGLFRGVVSLFGCEPVVFACPWQIGGYSRSRKSVLVVPPKVELRHVIALFCGFFQQVESFDDARLLTGPLDIAHGEVVLRALTAVCYGLKKPIDCLDEAWLHSITVAIANSQVVLGDWLALTRGKQIPLVCLGGVFFDSQALLIVKS